MVQRKTYLLILSALILILSACAQSPGSGGGADLSDRIAPSDRIAKNQGQADFLDGIFVFSMDAYLQEFNLGSIAGDVGADLYPATLISDWGGEFTIEADGKMNGKGRLVTEATVYVVNEELCGYAYTEYAQHDFDIKGQLKNVGEKYYLPIKIWDVTPAGDQDPVFGPGEPTCADPGPEETRSLDLYISTQRKAMVQFVIGKLHNPIGDQIEMGVELKTEIDDIEYTIFVSPEAVE